MTEEVKAMSKEDRWKEFCKLVINKKGNPSTRDLEDYGMPFEMLIRMSQMSDEKVIAWAKEVICKIEKGNKITKRSVANGKRKQSD